MDLELTAMIDLFAATKLTEGRSQTTVDWYKSMLRRFADFASNGHPAKLSELTVDAARSFVAALQSRTTRFEDHPFAPAIDGGLSPYSIHGYVRALKAFSAWLSEENFTNGDRLARLKRPRLPTPVIEILSDDELDRVFLRINPNCTLGARMYAISLLLLDTGIRASELCTLTLANTYFDSDYVKVLGKGNKERIVPFGATTKKALIRYVSLWRPTESGDSPDTLFLSTNGGQLSYSGLRQAMKRLGQRAEIPRLHPHLFRHTFAVRYLMNGGDVMTLKLMLGHTTLDVTQMYMHLAEAHIKVQHHRFSPADRLNLGRKRSKR
jgi:integrase/recombinase XerC/integrase/recombinase XerD